MESSIHQLEAIDRRDGSVLEILMDERDNGNWRFRRNMRICMPLESAIKTSEVAAVPHVAPEIALLFEAKELAPRMKQTFARYWKSCRRNRNIGSKQL